MRLGGFFTFSEPNFVRIQLASLGIRISDVTIYLDSLLFYKVDDVNLFNPNLCYAPISISNLTGPMHVFKHIPYSWD